MARFITVRFDRSWLVCLAALLFAVGAASVTTRADEDADEDNNATPKPAAKAPPMYPVPEGTVAELFEFTKTLPKKKFEADSFDEYKEHARKVRRSVAAAADKIIAGKVKGDKPSEAQAIEAIHVKIKALTDLGKLTERAAGENAAYEDIRQFLASLKGDQRPKLAKLRDGLSLKYKFIDGKAPVLDLDNMAQSVTDMAQFLGTVKIDQDHLKEAVAMANSIAGFGEKELAAKALRDFAQVVSKNKDKKLADFAKRMEGMARSMVLEGKPLEVFGKYLDGKYIDWADFKGKVVLVDFWATWCGPCIAELPNMQKNYEKYHAKGFEIVAVSLDTNRKQVEKFLKERKLPWKTLYSDDTKANGLNHPLAVHYDITAIPAMFLVDQKGNVVSLQARGPELSKKLEELLGKVEAAE